MESAVVDAPQHPIALTLLRSTRRTVGTAGEPDGLLCGKQTFHLRLVPLRGGVDRADLGQLGARLAAGLRMAQLTAADVEMLRPERILPAEQALLQVEGDALVSSFRQVDGALELRIYNPLPASQGDRRARLAVASALVWSSCQGIRWYLKSADPGRSAITTTKPAVISALPEIRRASLLSHEYNS